MVAIVQPPEVTLDNSDAVYDYYLNHRQNRFKTKAAYAILGRRYHPRVTYAPGAEDQIRRLVRSNTRLILSVNHLSTSDPYTVAACAWRSVLRPVIGRCRVLAKDELFIDDEQRRKVDMMGGIPVFRGKDHGIRAVNAAGQRMMDICAERLVRGDDLAVFPEGTCNDTDVTKVQSVGSGIGHITFRARKLGATPALLFLGLSYGGTDSVHDASCYLDTAVPDLDIPQRPNEITRLVVERMQLALDGAVANY